MSASPADRHATRSRETQARLLDATIAGLVELGYAGLTVRWVADRAGVTRGALQHHYGSKAELVAAAVRHLGALAVEGTESALASLPQDDSRVEAFVDTLWSLHSSALFVAGLELWAAARLDPSLATVVDQVEDDLSGALKRVATGLGPLADREGFAVDLEQVAATMRGFAMRSGLPRSAPRSVTWADVRPRMVALLAGITGN